MARPFAYGLLVTSRSVAPVERKGDAMRAFLGSTLAVLVLSAGLSADDKKDEKIDAKKLIGTWKPVKSKDPSTAAEFTKDGKIRVEVTGGGKTAVLDGTYKVEGGKLSSTLTLRGESDPKVDQFIYSIKTLTDKELVVENAAGKVETYSRSDKK